MDFGIDKILIDILKEHWLIVTLVFIGIISLKLFFEEILPSFIQRLEGNLLFKRGNGWRKNRELLEWLRNMHYSEFEEYVAEVFRRLGYQADVIGKVGDHGLDIKIEKEGIISYVQCKKYAATHKVGEPEVRNFLGSLAHEYVKGNGYFVTTSMFTMEATQFARGEQIDLVDGSRLVEYIRMAEKNGFIAKLEKTKLKKCHKCGADLVEKDGKFGKFFGCTTYPKCDYTESVEG